ncbi:MULTISPECIES: hypothetical protein [Pseudomonas]|uniref:hypothetical protein n=1 Tax=Pseudomonas TaxID=286 RepID=UPI00144A076B|nr:MULTISPECIES: hypothetical protein [Pseudomonas]MBP2274273.1 hypothetical protein [Pseudomonas sp. BP6]MBP2286756.1 hypothetical protein [Pseudomonas sp. BP7]QIZ23102.1 Hypothetical protein [Pseudomonas putida]QKL10071.1 hypothetical protein GEV41_28180 [Pseudomonas putida]WVM66940.1 hypothetical protein V1687_26350 [Pseudomonas putida]
MPSPSLATKPYGRAEKAFRDSFERLKNNNPIKLPKGSKVTQNNVAREAGLDPSALKKARFPTLVAEIQLWIDHSAAEPAPSKNQMLGAQKEKNRSLRDQIKALQEQRDTALALLVEADSKIFELTLENRRLRAAAPPSNVIALSTRDKS